MDTNARQQPIAPRPAAPQPQRLMTTPPKPKPPVPGKPAGAVAKPEVLAESPILYTFMRAGTPVVVALRSGRELKGKLVRITRWNYDIQDASGALLVVMKHAVDLIAKQV